MVLNELIIKNFGKFKDSKIEFNHGLNIIYGKNEAGKSTIHSFILGMLYGIEKTRVRKEIDIYERYLPWSDSGIYEGVMKLTIDDKMYRIRRSFLNKKAYCELREEESGTLLNLGGKEPGDYLLGISENTFKDTLFIGQLSSRTSEALSLDIKSYIANLSTTMNTEIDLLKVYDKLDREIKTNNSKSDDKQIKEIENELDTIEQNEILRDSISNSLNEKTKELEEVEVKINFVESSLNAISKKELLEKVDKCKELHFESEKNKGILESYQIYGSIKEDDLDLISKKRSQVKAINSEIQQLWNRNEELRRHTSELEESILLSDSSNNDFLEKDNCYENYLEKEMQAQSIINNEMEHLNKGNKNHKNYIRLLQIIITVSIIVNIIRIFTSDADVISSISISVGVLLVGSGLIYFFRRAHKKEMQNKEVIIDKAKQEIATINYIKPLLSKLKTYNYELNNNQNLIERRNFELKSVEEYLSELYLETGIKEEQDIQLLRSKIKEYHQLSNQIDKDETVLRVSLDGKSLEELLRLAELYQNSGSDKDSLETTDDASYLTKDELKTRMKQLRQDRDDLVRRTSTLKGKLEELENLDARRTEAEERLDKVNSLREKALLEQQALKLAKDKIQQISDKIQKGFGKKLDHKVSSIIETITNGKYININIDTDSKMTVDDGYHNIDIERLSLGTVDQMFLSLRMGVDHLLHSHIDLPILLDDTFALYDDERVANLLKWMVTLDKQILIFTCQRRELEILQETKSDSNIIILE